MTGMKVAAIALAATIWALPAQETNHEGVKALCKEAKYTAVQSGSTLTVKAEGEHRTGGYSVEFEQDPKKTSPVQLSFYHWAPKGMAAQVISPFTKEFSLPSKRRVRSIMIIDGNGEHAVTVARGR